MGDRDLQFHRDSKYTRDPIHILLLRVLRHSDAKREVKRKRTEKKEGRKEQGGRDKDRRKKEKRMTKRRKGREECKVTVYIHTGKHE